MISQLRKNISALQQGKYFEIKIYRKSKDGNVKRVREFYSQFKVVKCRYCGRSLDVKDATIEHIIPLCIVEASMGYIKPKYGMACNRCNSGNQIHNCVGALFSSTDIRQVETASRYLCDLVRCKHGSKSK